MEKIFTQMLLKIQKLKDKLALIMPQHSEIYVYSCASFFPANLDYLVYAQSPVAF